MSTDLPPQTRAYLDHSSLERLWSDVRTRLERNGLQATGVLTVDLEEEGVDRLSGLLGPGRRVASPAKVHLAVLDAALRSSAAAAGLVSVVEALTGPLTDRKAVRAERTEGRANIAAHLDAVLAQAGLNDQEWVPTFVEGVRRSGLLTRAGSGAEAAVAHAGAALAELVAVGALEPGGTLEGWCGLAELATKCTGDAHGLDAGRAAPALVLRAVAAAFGVSPPESAAQVRDLWSQVGVTPDEVSGTVLVLGLRPPGADPWSAMMRARADLGLVTHLTVHELRGAAANRQWVASGALVSVCENPQVLQAVSRAGGTSSPLVCTSGNPATAGWVLLHGLLAQGALVRYHGDFDWPGVAIAGRMVAAGVAPWRLNAGDYLDAAEAPPGVSSAEVLELTGRRVETPWDPELAAAMARTGIAVHEEALLEVLLGDLADPER